MADLMEITAHSGKKIRIYGVQGPSELGKIAVDLIVEASREKWQVKDQNQPTPFVLGLPTGSTPLPLYRELEQRCKNKELSLKNFKVFFLDEYYPISPQDQNSYNFYVKKNLLLTTDLPPDNFYIPDGETKDVPKTCQEYEGKIRECGGIDLQVLGIGVNGHIGFNEPGSSPNSITRMVKLSASTRERAIAQFGSIEKVPQYAITMGLKTILQAKRAILLAMGTEKSEALYKAFFLPVSTDLPASYLQHFQGDLAIIADKEALRRILDENSGHRRR